LRFKHGTHTIFLFVDPVAPFSKITEELLELLRERYPDGLSLSNKRPELTRVPQAGEDARVSYATLKNPRDPTSGWRDLKISGNETPASKNLKENTVVAFTLEAGDEEPAESPEFDVEFPELAEDDEAGDVSE